MVRKILAVVVGIVAGSIVNMAIVTLSNNLYPYPETVDPNDFDAVRAHIEANGMAMGAMLLILAAHSIGSLASGLVCGLIAKRPWYAAAIGLGLLWTAGGIAMLMILPAPLWFQITDVVLYVPAAILGVMIGGGITATKVAGDT